MARHESIVNTGVFSHQPYVQISTGAEGQARKGYIWIMGGGCDHIHIYIYMYIYTHTHTVCLSVPMLLCSESPRSLDAQLKVKLQRLETQKRVALDAEDWGFRVCRSIAHPELGFIGFTEFRGFRGFRVYSVYCLGPRVL